MKRLTISLLLTLTLCLLAVSSVFAKGEGITLDGQELLSRVLTGIFVSAGEGWGAVSSIIFPAVIVLLVLVLAVIIPAITTRGKLEHLPLGSERDYGFRGGAICPKCHRPFAMHLWGLNLGLGRYDRCPYCGKWSIVSSKSLAKLREAERDELSWKQAEVPQKSEKDRLRKEIEDSKYI